MRPSKRAAPFWSTTGSFLRAAARNPNHKPGNPETFSSILAWDLLFFIVLLCQQGESFVPSFLNVSNGPLCSSSKTLHIGYSQTGTQKRGLFIVSNASLQSFMSHSLGFFDLTSKIPI